MLKINYKHNDKNQIIYFIFIFKANDQYVNINRNACLKSALQIIT